MARRSAAGRGGVLEADTPGVEAEETFDAEPAQRGRSRRPKAGAGGRWWVWVGRAVLWAFILVVLFNGIWMPFRAGFNQPAQEAPPETATVNFPETAAASFAAQFAAIYLNADPEEPAQRAEELAAFVPEGRAATFNLTGATLSATGIEVVGVDALDDNNAVVRLTASVGGEPVSLDVPVYASDNGSALVVSGRPALLAAPDKAELPAAPTVETDPQAEGELQPRLEGFFDAYAQSPQFLDPFIEPGAPVVPLPTGTVEFGSLGEITVPVASSGNEDVRVVQATVAWQVPGGGNNAELTQSYRLTVVKDGESWYVRDIQGAPNSFG
ncbi:conjugal transfer protein [Nocardiopsis ansamitocini]|uniref:Conjugative transposon protein TcpC n=1 Tax=Nocardiopsis ansamitocini TaxID=1670832 RepID=A0A9W6UHN8_9ACTN|nr:conjugal transfer protein [Nocardiopsis ansamitocini]GLU46819.1 hypothetical protein Nans01_11700 [Nocardiopsis ansamitocini]